MNEVVETIIARGDLAHLALFLWASSMTALTVTALRALFEAHRRFDDFVQTVARINTQLEAEE